MTVLWTFLLCIAGFSGLLLAMTKHFEQFFTEKRLPGWGKGVLRIAGCCFLYAALQLNAVHWGWSLGTVYWLGMLTLAACGIIFTLPWLLGEYRQKRRKKTAVATTPNPKPLWLQGCLWVLMLLPLCWYGWLVYQAPLKALYRADAIHSEVGPYSLVIAEYETTPPEHEGQAVVKAFVLKFCDDCTAQVKQAYLKIRKPRSLRAAGTAFTGGHELWAEILIPPGAALTDGIWLTVEDIHGQVFYTEFDIARLSPATARYLQEKH